MADIVDIAQDVIDARLRYELERLNAGRSDGPALAECEDCGDEIAEARRLAMPGVRRCVHCQEIVERRGGAA